MGKLTDLNITGLHPAKHASLLGDAHEMIVAGILIRLGFEVGLMGTKGGSYDLWIIGFKEPHGEIKPLRAQVKTISGSSIRFTGGTRGGINRHYIRPSPKEYKYTEKDNDLIIGVQLDTLDLYLVPTRFISKWGKSRSVKKLQPLRNNWDILLNWRDDFLDTLEESLPP